MSDEEIDRLADAHGYRVEGIGIEFTTQQFRAAVREAVRLEREACAKVCEDQADAHSDRQFLNTQAAIGCDGCAAAIRARSQEGQ